MMRSKPNYFKVVVVFNIVVEFLWVGGGWGSQVRKVDGVRW